MYPAPNTHMDEQVVGRRELDSQDSGLEGAVYARYSDEKQRKSSIEDQVRNCRGEAKQVGCWIPEANIFADPDVRGSLEHRPELDRLMEIVRSGRAPFRDLFIADTSRLARNSALAPKLRKFFDHHGVRLHFVENGMKSGTSGFNLQHTFQGYIDEQYSEQLGEKVSRGQIGCVLKGYMPSGTCFGYRNVPEEHPTRTAMYGRPEVIGVRQVCYDGQVKVVLLIFRMYAAGEGGYGQIAQKLNQMGVLSPREAVKNTVRGWNHATVRAILNNERYIGRVTFRKTKTSRDPETGRLKHKKRPEAEWVTYFDPSLQIVPDELWAAVRARQRLVRDTFGGVKAGGMARSPVSQSYLFSGLLRCGCCGGSMVLTNGPEGAYKCSNARRKSGCSNHQSIHRRSLEGQLMDRLATTIRAEANIGEFTRLFRQRLNVELQRREEAVASAVSGKDGLFEERRQLTVALENLAEEVAAHGGSDTLRSMMRRKEKRKAEVDVLLSQSNSPAKQVSDAEIDNFLRKAFAELGDTLLGDPLRSRQELQKRISWLTLTPIIHDGSPAYVVSGNVGLFSDEDVVMLRCTMDSTAGHHSFDISLTGSVLKLGAGSRVVSVLGPTLASEPVKLLREAA